MGTRDTILDAAAHVMRTQGLARATTKEIAKQAGYSEATLYKHFHDKTELFVDVLRERVPSFAPLLATLTEQAGRGDLRGSLLELGRAAIAFYYESFPMSASIYSEPRLLATHRASLGRRRAGPHVPGELLTGYLRAEQELGRIASTVDTAAASALLLGACLQYAFLGTFADRKLEDAAVTSYLTGVVDTLLPALAPGPRARRRST